MKILGLGHYSRTGKDTLARLVCEQNQALFPDPLVIKQISLAWKLKQICHELYGWAGVESPEFYDDPETEHYRDVPLPKLGGMTVVELWVKFGTPAIRENVYDRTWIDYVLKTDHDCDLLIVRDIRFPNEVEAFREEGAYLVKCVREGYGPRNTKADQALITYTGWDYVAGESSIETLQEDAWILAHWAYGHLQMYQPPSQRKHRLGLETVHAHA